MKKRALLPLFSLITPLFCVANTFNCADEFAWLKATFETNDAGFHYAVSNKGQAVYEAHNRGALASAQAASGVEQCHVVLRDWLAFFRKGHIGLSLNSTGSSEAVHASAVQPFDVPAFKQYLKNKNEEDLEGLWQFSSYTVALKKEENAYRAYITESKNPAWQPGQVKFVINDVDGDKDSANITFFMGDHSPYSVDRLTHLGRNEVVLGDNFIVMSRLAPRQESSPEMKRYVRLLNAKKPSFEKVSETTALVRIPSFELGYKQEIDALIAANLDTILRTENLIIDIRGNGGGSDVSYESLLPLIYTNPIRVIEMEYLSTPLNNSRMLSFMDNPHFSDEEKAWAKSGYDTLSKHLGQFVILGDALTIKDYETVHAYPKSVGVLINNRNGSTAEQFLLAAKQSKKVKLFGQTTAGVLDISNMYQVDSPSKHFTLHYSLTRSLRIPHMAIDGKGLQPDYYIDSELPVHQWISHTQSMLEGV